MSDSFSSAFLCTLQVNHQRIVRDTLVMWACRCYSFRVRAIVWRTYSFLGRPLKEHNRRCLKSKAEIIRYEFRSVPAVRGTMRLQKPCTLLLPGFRITRFENGILHAGGDMHEDRQCGNGVRVFTIGRRTV